MTIMTSSLSAIVSLFMMLNHPLMLVILLIGLTLLIIMNLMMKAYVSWISMILFLVFLGGLLMIFTYLAALIPNEIYYFNMVWLVLFLNPLFSNQFSSTKMMSSQKMNLKSLTFMGETSTLPMFLGYLLVTLLVTMMMSQQLKTPLSQNSN